MSSEFDLEAYVQSHSWSPHMQDQNKPIFLDDRTPGDVPVKITVGDLVGALAVAARWRGESPSDLIRPELLTCLQNGLIGVSRPMQDVAGQLGLWANSSDHLVVRGEEGTNFRGVASCLLKLAADQRETDAFERWPQAQFGVYICGSTLFVYDIEALSRQDQGAVLDAMESGVRVIGFSNRSRDVMLEALSPSLANHLAVAGLVDVPPLCVRPDDLPLLAFYYLSQYTRGKHGVHGITVSSLYMMSGERFSMNELALRSWLKDACEDPCDEWAHLWNSEEAEGPFVPGGAAFQAAADLPGTPVHTDYHLINADNDLADTEEALVHSERDLPVVSGLLVVNMPDLPGYDLKGLLEAVDAATEPGQKGRWTLDRRLGHLQEESCGDRRKAATEASPSDPATYVADGDEETKGGADNIFRRTDSGWEFRYAGGAFYALDDDNGSRAMAYLLSAWMQPPHPDVRYPEGGAAEVLSWVRGQKIDTRTQEGPDVRQAIAEYLLKLDEIDERRAKIESDSLNTLLLTDQREEELANEDKRLVQEASKIQTELNRLTDVRGRPRNPRPPGVEAVESALRRVKESIKKKSPDLHKHLTKALKMGATPRYSPDVDVQWEVRL